MRHLRVAPGAGEQDDLGWGELQDQISAWEMKLLAEMQYPKQLAILATLNELREQVTLNPNPKPSPNPHPHPHPHPILATLNELREQAALVHNLTLTLSLSPTLTLTLAVTLT